MAKKRRKYSPSAGRDVELEMRRYERGTARSGKGGKGGKVKSRKQAIAIGLSKARRAGVKVPPPKKGQASAKTRRSAESASRHGKGGHSHKTNPRRSQAITKALQRESHQAASHKALSNQAKQQARKRTAEERSEIGRKAAKTRLAHQTPEERSAIARKAARTRMARS